MRGRWGAALALLWVALPASAATPAEAEIDKLISALSASGCEFQRNGRWHTADRATQHLQRKYDWLRQRDLAPTAEVFIERAASESSTSGRPYRVRCPGRETVSSAQWFGERLRDLRTTGSPQSPR